jgi:hypothetical protein
MTLEACTRCKARFGIESCAKAAGAQGDIEETLAKTLACPQRHIEVRGQLPCSPNPVRAMDVPEINRNDRRHAVRGVDMERNVIGLCPMESFISSLPSLQHAATPLCSAPSWSLSNLEQCKY